VADFSEITKQFKESQSGKNKPAQGRIAAKVAKFKQDKIASEFKLVELSSIAPDPNQPRRIKDTKSRDLKSLAKTIKEKGVLEPLLVRETATGFLLVAGERRYWASHIAKLRAVPVRVVHLNSQEIAEVQLIENIQRKDLNPLERARGLKNIADSGGSTKDIYKRVAISRSLYYALLSLLNLPEEIQDKIDQSYANENEGIPLRELIELAKIKDINKLKSAFEDLDSGTSLIEERQKNNPKASTIAKNKVKDFQRVSNKQGVEILLRIPAEMKPNELDLEDIDALWQEVLNKL